jgi:hypothetical protein
VQQPLCISLTAHTATIVLQVRKRRFEKKLRTYLEKIRLDLEEAKQLGCIWDAENNTG